MDIKTAKRLDLLKQSGLYTRLIYCLINAGLASDHTREIYWEEVGIWSRKELMELPNFGKKCMSLLIEIAAITENNLMTQVRCHHCGKPLP